VILPQIACIVEGHGDVEAVPVLVRRIAALLDPGIGIHVLPPLRVPRFKLVKARECERAVEFVARKTAGRGGVLVLVDAEDDCPAQLGPQLLDRARQTRSDLPIAVVLAKHEFETWFLAAAESLRGRRGLAADLTAPTVPESIRGAKEWLSDRMTEGIRYRETLDQPALASVFDLTAAIKAASFDKCFREITALIDAVRQQAAS
jgi:hypothetical protein